MSEYQAALKISEGLAAMDPKNVSARRIVAGCCWQLGMIPAQNQPEQAVEYCRRSLRFAEEIGAGDPPNAEYRYHASRALVWMVEGPYATCRMTQTLAVLASRARL
jgi:hypothetical protein